MKWIHMKKMVVIQIISLSLLCFILVGITIAYLTDVRSTLNSLRIGNSDANGRKAVQVALVDREFYIVAGSDGTFPAEAGRLDGEYSKFVLNNVIPGMAWNMDAQVGNVGNEDIYVRLQLLDEDGNAIDFTEGFTGRIELDIEDHWIEQKGADGRTYYYYGQNDNCMLLKPEENLPVFEKKPIDEWQFYSIKIPGDISNEEIKEYGYKFTVDVVAEAIQAKNFTPEKIQDGVDVWGNEEIHEAVLRQ